jgi:hypothetical protein
MASRSKPAVFREHSVLQGNSLPIFTDPAQFVRALNALSQLTDDDFESAVHETSFRLAVLYMTKAVIEGNLNATKACDLYLARCDKVRQRRAERARLPASAVAPSGAFMVPDRTLPLDGQEESPASSQSPADIVPGSELPRSE